MKEFNEYSVGELIDLISDLHLEKKMSIRAIARELKTYPLKICRFCNKHQIPIMTASESLKSAYEAGTLINPRKGVTLSEIEKLNIGEAQHRVWANLSDYEMEVRREIQRKLFEQRKDKKSFQKKGADGIRKAAREGSKLEKFLIKLFKKEGIRFIHHYKGMFGDNQLEADFFLPDLNVILEVDGPSHFCDIFGTSAYQKQVEADQKKNAIVLNMGASMFRLVHMTTLYKRDYNIITYNLIPLLKNLNNELKVVNVENLGQ